jgi:hypothetical protein
VPTIHPNPERFIGSGTVFIAWDPEENAYFGYWDSSSDGTPGTPLAELSSTGSQREAVEWGQHRAPRVLIRPEQDPGVYYWAGIGEPQGTDIDLKRLQP